MRWVVALFLALLSIPVAQVAADAWSGRPGPELLAAGPRAEGSKLAPDRHSRHLLDESYSPWFPSRAKASARTS